MSQEEAARKYVREAKVNLHFGEGLDLLKDIPDNEVQLVVTSPPYNLGKRYEVVSDLSEYLRRQTDVLRECVRVLSPTGHLCWQVGNMLVSKGEILPLDIALHPIIHNMGMKLRNRIVWHFEHGLHCAKRFSGRYETILWFTKSDSYYFNLDPVRVPQKYPGKKYFKGPRKGELSCNPLGKNPGDVWIIPNVKHNHIEKTEHPCQFPVELVERLVLSMTRPGELLLDPYMGVGSALCAALLHNRRAAGADIVREYVDIAQERAGLAILKNLPTRPMFRAIHTP